MPRHRPPPRRRRGTPGSCRSSSARPPWRIDAAGRRSVPCRRHTGCEIAVEFQDVVMKRRAVRRFEEGGVDRAVIERIARLAQRTPSAGFSQGQRLVVVVDRGRRREGARICGEEQYEPLFGPWISECAAQFIPCVSETIYHRRYQEPDK